MNNNKRKIKWDIKRVVAIILSVFIIFIMVASVVIEDKTYSENENRYLPSFPEFSLSALLSGDYIAKVESYLQDQFPGRDFFVSGKAEAELLLGKDQNNGVYYGKDDFMIDQFFAVSDAELEKRVKYINSFIEKLDGVEVHFALAPTSGLVNADKLPSDIPDDDIAEVIGKVNSMVNGNIVELSAKLTEVNKLQQLYFKTDHHWNTYGAYYAYVEIMASLGFDAISLSQYNEVVLADNFKGTMYSQGGFFGSAGEVISTLQNITPSDLVVTYVASGVVTDTLFADKYLEEKDKYGYFGDGNHPMITVENKNAVYDSHILVVKDSYANIMLPFLCDSFSKVTVVDLRFYGGSLSEYVEAEGVSDVVILYNVDGFQTDTGIYKLR